MADTSLLGVVVGGVIALAGFVVRDVLQEWRDKKKRRADKFEELVAAVYEFDHWIEAARDKYVYGRDVPETVSPFAKVQSISSIYFPQFRILVGELNSAALMYRVWMLGAQGKRLNGLANFNDGFKDVIGPYIDAHGALLNALQEFAREHFQDEEPQGPKAS
jgi:hypothetical protein